MSDTDLKTLKLSRVRATGLGYTGQHAHGGFGGRSHASFGERSGIGRLEGRNRNLIGNMDRLAVFSGSLEVFRESFAVKVGAAADVSGSEIGIKSLHVGSLLSCELIDSGYHLTLKKR